MSARVLVKGGCVAILLVAVLAAPALGQLPTRYCLLEGSLLVTVEDPTTEIQLHGTFDLLPSAVEGLYVVQNFRGFDSAGSVVVRAEGTYRQDDAGQRMVLNVAVGGSTHLFDSGVQPYYTTLPMIDIVLRPVAGTSRTPRLVVVAAPIVDVWFSTEVGFHTPNGTAVSDGDALSVFGIVLWTNFELTRNLGIMPVVPDIGLDALCPAEIDEVPWWEAWFSPETSHFSETLGWLQHGDFLSEGGFIVERNQSLTWMFAPTSECDLGLDAITWGWPCYGWYFSTEVDFYSEPLGLTVGHGDLLCAAHGEIVYTNQELLARFRPVEPDYDYGLDAVYLWPSGHIWFSTEEPFRSGTYGWIGDGDLLSNDGHVICRNLDLVRRFRPVEDLHNFGLDALHIVPILDDDPDDDGELSELGVAP
ncbi:MAG: hypothetical protein PVJ57_05360 [Phycisphaerae bacterium]|jgi:hypothetical protein